MGGSIPLCLQSNDWTARGIPRIRARRRGRACDFRERLTKIGNELIAGLLGGGPASVSLAVLELIGHAQSQF